MASFLLSESMRRHKLHPFALIVCLLGISALITAFETLTLHRHNAPAKHPKLIQASKNGSALVRSGEHFR